MLLLFYLLLQQIYFGYLNPDVKILSFLWEFKNFIKFKIQTFFFFFKEMTVYIAINSLFWPPITPFT